MGRDAHDDARAVAHQHVITYQDRHTFTVQQVRCIRSGVDACLFFLSRQTLDFGLPLSLLDIVLHLGTALRSRQLLDQRVLRSEHDERHTEDRVDTRRVRRDRLLFQSVLGDVEVDIDALASTDPVGLHRVDLLRPLDRGLVQQFVRVVGHAEQPLIDVTSDDLRATPLAPTVLHLFIGQDGVARWTPVGRRVGSIGQSRLVELVEQPLVPLVVVGHTGNQLTVPIIDRPHRAQLTPHVLDVIHRAHVRMHPVLDRRVLGRQSKGVEAHRVQDVEPLHPPKAGMGVRGSHRVPMADVEVAGRVGVHREFVPVRTRVVVPNGVEPALVPTLLPLALDFRGHILPRRLSLLYGRHGTAPSLLAVLKLTRRLHLLGQPGPQPFTHFSDTKNPVPDVKGRDSECAVNLAVPPSFPGIPSPSVEPTLHGRKPSETVVRDTRRR